MKGVHIFMAQGFEDMEALATRDVLVRGGVPVITVSITDEYIVQSSHGLDMMADTCWEDVEVMEPDTDAMDMMIFPGGMPGSQHLAGHTELMEILQDHWERGGAVAAICAAPGLVVSQLPGLEGKRFTCFEGFQEALIGKGAIYTPEGTVSDGRLITGRAAGYAIDFGLAILRYLKGDQAAENVRKSLML